MNKLFMSIVYHLRKSQHNYVVQCHNSYLVVVNYKDN